MSHTAIRSFRPEIEGKFIRESANATRVELEHRKFEQMGAEPGETMRRSVDGGWPGMLERFKSAVEAERGTSFFTISGSPSLTTVSPRNANAIQQR